MAFNKNDNKNIKNIDYIKTLTDTAKSLATCSENIQEDSENIRLSCQTPGTKGEANKTVLLDKADNLERLAILYGSASKRFMNDVEKLEKGEPEEKVLSDVLIYNTFLEDQVKGHECDIEHIHNMLKDDKTNTQVPKRF